MNQEQLNMKQGGFIKVSRTLRPGSQMMAMVEGPQGHWLSATAFDDEQTFCLFEPTDIPLKRGDVVILEIEQLNITYYIVTAMKCRLVKVVSSVSPETV